MTSFGRHSTVIWGFPGTTVGTAPAANIVDDDVRAVQDVRIEKNESHAGKVVERRWYERNKHIFPASRWEIYDPNKAYGDYTIHGGAVHARNGKIGADL